MLMGSKRLLTAGLIGLALLTGGCDDEKSAETTATDVAGLADAQRTAEQAQKKQERPDPQKAKEKVDKERTSASSPSSATVGAQPPLDISNLLTREDVEKFTRGSVVSEALAGKEPSPEYNAIHLHPGGRTFYGAGLQVWKLDSKKAAIARIESLSEQYLAVDEPPEAAPFEGDADFISERAGITSYVFAAGDKPAYAVAVSCGDQFCKKPEQLFELSKTVRARLDALEEAAASKKEGEKDKEKEGEKDKEKAEK